MRWPAAVFGLWLAVAGGATEAARFVAFSDVHLDPMADPALVEELLAADAGAWAGILDRGRASFGAFGRDSTWPLVRSALDSMRAAEPDPAFLLVTGDLLAHDFRARFDAAAPGSDEARYDAFVLKTVEFLGREIAGRFPGKRVFLALGNNDDFCGDYMLTPDGAFLAATEPMAEELLGVEGDAAFARDWDDGHGYDLPNGSIPGLRMVFLNSVFLSPGYDEACAQGGAHKDPGHAAMDWLAGRLAAAERAGEKVWLFSHIPPGADAYATLHQGSCPDGLRAMWTATETERYLDLIARHAGTVAATFAGHTHMDEFRLLGRGAEPDGFVLVVPGVSPIFGQNPGFQVYEADAAGRLLDGDTWALTNLEGIGPGVAPAWGREYRFSELWGLRGLDLATLGELAARIGADEATRAAWYSVFRVGRPAAWGLPGGAAGLPPQVFGAYGCAISAVGEGAYRACLCGR
jgi:sphingomyelin phosphodiesterase acid-like 3